MPGCEHSDAEFCPGFSRLLASVLAMLLAVPVSASMEEETIAALRAEIAALRARVERLESEKSSRVPVEYLDVAVSGSEQAQTVEEPETAPDIAMGGALRFNLIYREDVEDSTGKRGEGGLDMFRLSVDGEVEKLLLSAEYRFYPYMNVIHHGWIGYDFGEQGQIQGGITQVPFGLLPYASHNFWYGVPYYAGFADDYDVGVKYQRQDGAWNTHIAFFKSEELNDATNADRFAFDLVRAGEQQNEESNQLNLRSTYTLGLGTLCETEVGASYEIGEIYNAVTRDRGDRWAAMAHLDSRCGRWNFQLQGGRYEFDPANPPGVDSGVVRLGAFGGTYDLDSEAEILVANVAYNLQPPWQYIDSLTCYNDYSRLYKSLEGAIDSQVNTLGCAIGTGPIFTYVDYIFANNMPYFGDGTLGRGGEDDWKGRLNINVGYYW